MTGQQQHLTKTLSLFISSSALFPMLFGTVTEADESPSTAKVKPKNVRGKCEAQDFLVIKQVRFLCKLNGEQGNASCLLQRAQLSHAAEKSVEVELEMHQGASF